MRARSDPIVNESCAVLLNGPVTVLGGKWPQILDKFCSATLLGHVYLHICIDCINFISVSALANCVYLTISEE